MHQLLPAPHGGTVFMRPAYLMALQPGVASQMALHAATVAVAPHELSGETRALYVKQFV